MKEKILKPNTTMGMNIFMVVFVLCVFAPMELYLSNNYYFFFGGEDILPYAMGFCIIAWLCVMIGFILVEKINKKINNVLVTLFWSIGIALYYQGNFFG